MKNVLGRYLLNLLVSFDQLVNSALGGDPDMTLSGRAGRALAEGRCKLCGPLCWALGKIDKDHCARASKLERDEGIDETVRW